jgi:hypothetical protein
VSGMVRALRARAPPLTVANAPLLDWFPGDPPHCPFCVAEYSFLAFGEPFAGREGPVPLGMAGQDWIEAT